ncbi:unnamed protein product [Adineta ricciae]|uniref:Major facilitator superfamily (MFS) profile domain-containing protein n=1 Tax=Adineta ricciae TaxID=249248 RepID=A0A815HNQ6_ADIRI|nr:unnamed protein product [Adineta ricciae]CAF1461909.1 unnamed protein product [Adineta ricciae]
MASKSPYLNNPWYLIKTGFLLLAWIVMGIHVELIAPPMLILAENLHVDSSGIGSILGCQGIGYLAANILETTFGKIIKKHSDGLLSAAFILPSIVSLYVVSLIHPNRIS